MHSTSYPRTGRLWNKFRSSTKSISTSLSQLSLRQERDGDSPNSTIVHKALVKFYSSQEPFQGFPEWLGHKEELPNEQKVLRKQKNHVHEILSNSIEVTRKTQSHTESLKSSSTRRSAGTDFRGIYKASVDTVSQTTSTKISPESNGEYATTDLPGETQRTSSMLMRERLKRSSRRERKI